MDKDARTAEWKRLWDEYLAACEETRRLRDARSDGVGFE